MMDVKLIRLVTGEEIVAEVLDWSNGMMTIKNALVVIPSARAGWIYALGNCN